MKQTDGVFLPEKYKTELIALYDFASNLLKKKVQGELKGASRMANEMQKALRTYPKDNTELFSRSELVAGFKWLLEQKIKSPEEGLIELIRLKPTRTISGVAPVTVLTKPYPCPGQCIFCPNDIRMPKSYIASEPGAQRAGRNAFDPYLQTYNRLQALDNIGHNVSKVELIVLGGTWSFYPENYQIWFIKRCFDAMNDFGVADNRISVNTDKFTSETQEPAETVNYNLEIVKSLSRACGDSASWQELATVQELNESSLARCVGMVLETRPDSITENEVLRLRRLGATKIQIGVQSLSDSILLANKRGTTVAQIRRAFELLRMAGFKIHAHMMPNLYRSDLKTDIADYLKLWGPDFAPDELKIYPTSVIKGTELYRYFKEGHYQPYSAAELEQYLKEVMLATPRYCRLTRIIRDIPSQEIAAGNKRTNLRQIVELQLKKEDLKCQCIRCREIKNQSATWADLEQELISYPVKNGTEYFISYKTKANDKILGFVRLSLSDKSQTKKHFTSELQDAAVIREVHVYGKVTDFGASDTEHIQHLGIGRTLVAEAEKIARDNGFEKIAVISAIGTRNYYRKLGFERKDLYMHKFL